MLDCNNWIRYGVVKYESVMELRHELEKLGEISGTTNKEEGILNKICVFNIQ